MHVSFRCFRRVWLQQYRPLIPPSWVQSVREDGRMVEVCLEVSEWDRPPAAVLWRDRRSVRFPTPLWECVFSFLLPLAWIDDVEQEQRSVHVQIDPTVAADQPLCVQAPAIFASFV